MLWIVSNPHVVEDLHRVEMDYIQNMYPTVLIQAKLEKVIKMQLVQFVAAEARSSLGCLLVRQKVLYAYMEPTSPSADGLKRIVY